MSSAKYIWQVATGKAGFSFLNTLIVNYRLFPRETARLLPLKIGRRVDLRGLERGSIRFREGLQPHRYMLRIGCESWPMYSPKYLTTWFWFHKGATLTIGDEGDFCAGSRLIITSKASVKIGDDFFANNNSLIYCTKEITAGDHLCIGWDAQIYDSDFHLVTDQDSPSTALNPASPITIGDNVWIANRATVAKGSVIPSDTVIAAGSLVNKPLNESGLYAGTPAILKKAGVRRIWDKKLEAKLRRKL